MKLRNKDASITCAGSNLRVKKSAAIIEFYGALDELNAFLGFAAVAMSAERVERNLLQKIYRIQSELITIAAVVFAGKKSISINRMLKKMSAELTAFNASLPQLNTFLLLGGNETSSRLHLARVACRRAERIFFGLAETHPKLQIIGDYLNCLSSWLYAVARMV